jgi:LysR family glycine cleavage system transcriptional activator
VRNLDLTSGMHFDDGHLVLQAAAEGYGVALGRLTYAVDDLAARRLKIPFGPLVETDLKYYLLLPESRAGEPSIDAFRAWIVDEAARFRMRLREAARSAGPPVRAGVNGTR